MRYGLHHVSIRDVAQYGLQSSVVRRRVFDTLRFSERYRVLEDQVLGIRAAAAGYRFAYFDRVHVTYRVHGAHTSAAGASAPNAEVCAAAIGALRELLDSATWRPGVERALRKRIARELFWMLGYACQWAGGQQGAALRSFREAMHLWPWSPRMWKTYLLCLMRSRLSNRLGE